MKPIFETKIFDCKWIPARTSSVTRAVKRLGQRRLVEVPNGLQAPESPGALRTSPLGRDVSDEKVMIVLHGRGDSIKAFTMIQSELRLPEMNFLLLNAPRRFAQGFSWYPSEPKHKEGVCEARARLFELVEELKAFGFKSENIFWLGHSQGCLIACDLVLNHPDRFGGLVGVSGYLWFFRGWKKKILDSGAYGTPWLITHGTRDRIIRPREIREDIAALLDQAVPVLYREFPKGHDFDFSHEVPFIRRWLKTRQMESAWLRS